MQASDLTNLFWKYVPNGYYKPEELVNGFPKNKSKKDESKWALVRINWNWKEFGGIWVRKNIVCFVFVNPETAYNHFEVYFYNSDTEEILSQGTSKNHLNSLIRRLWDEAKPKINWVSKNG